MQHHRLLLFPGEKGSSTCTYTIKNDTNVGIPVASIKELPIRCIVNV